MDSQKYLNDLTESKANNKLFKLFVYFMGIGLIFNAFITYTLSKRARTIVVPPVVNTQFEISGDNLSEDYVRMMTRYVIGLAYNYNPDSARQSFEELLSLWDPASYADRKKEFYDMVETIRTARVTSQFFIQSIHVDDKNRTIEVTGQKRQYADDKIIKDGPETYTIEYTNNNGRFAVAKLSQKSEKEK